MTRRTRGAGIGRLRSESRARSIRPVLFVVHPLTADGFPKTENRGNCHVSDAVDNWLVMFVLSGLSSIPHRFGSASHSVPVAEHDWTYGWIRPKR